MISVILDRPDFFDLLFLPIIPEIRHRSQENRSPSSRLPADIRSLQQRTLHRRMHGCPSPQIRS